MTEVVPDRRAKQRITLGIVRIVVIAPIAFGMPLPLMMLLGSWLPFYVGLVAGGMVAMSGAIETARGLGALRQARRAQLTVPEARLIDRR